MGLSSYKSGRKILDWPNDVVELAAALRLYRFSVLGFSGGAPYAVACAYKIPDRLLACGVVSGVGRVGPLLSFLAQWLPWIIMPLTRRLFVDEERTERTLQRLASSWPEPDKQTFGQSMVRKTMSASLNEAFRPGIRGTAYDGALLGRDWGFRLEDVGFVAVRLWHGALDREAPEAAARATAEAIPHCKATYYPNESHISVIANHGREIVDALRARS
jgi:pimeloyl-ACP methyl ester carboxylesterase